MLLGGVTLAPGPAAADETLIKPRLFGDARLRYEHASDASFDQSSDAVTLRARLGLDVPITRRIWLIIEGEAIGALVDNFDDGVSPPPELPVIADPTIVELNRFQLGFEPVDDVRIIIGRQNLSLDDERFLGSVDFRQNQQTYDAVSASWSPSSVFALDVGYVRQTQRIFGRGELDRFEGDSYFANASVEIPFGRLTGFHYAFDLETGPEDASDETASSQTTGARLDGRWQSKRAALKWEASFARQTDFAGNPVDYSANYWAAALTAEVDDFFLGYRFESLGAGTIGFQTPLGTLHKFQGEADVFLETPDVGIVDHSVSAGWRVGAIGPLRGVAASVRAHWFGAEADQARLGREVDVSVSARLDQVGLSFIFADYQADTFAADVRRVFFAISRRF